MTDPYEIIMEAGDVKHERGWNRCNVCGTFAFKDECKVCKRTSDLSLVELARFRFFKKVTITDTCWVWTGNKTIRGYGMMCLKKKRYMATHISWLIHYGSLPDLFILHKCDNPGCVNPIHLYQGTQDDNMKDCVSKGRSSRGEKRHWAKLKESDVIHIRTLRGTMKKPEIAKLYQVHPETIGQIFRRITWKHI